MPPLSVRPSRLTAVSSPSRASPPTSCWAIRTSVSGSVGGGNCSDIFVHDRLTGVTERVSVASDGTEGNGDSDRPSGSGVGRFVAAEGGFAALVLGATSDPVVVFVHDRLAAAAEPGESCAPGARRGGVAAEGP